MFTTAMYVTFSCRILVGNLWIVDQIVQICEQTTEPAQCNSQKLIVGFTLNIPKVRECVPLKRLQVTKCMCM